MTTQLTDNLPRIEQDVTNEEAEALLMGTFGGPEDAAAAERAALDIEARGGLPEDHPDVPFGNDDSSPYEGLTPAERINKFLTR